MKENINPELFESLPIPRKELPQVSKNLYRVYSDTTKFIVVEAGNAQEALTNSGVKQAHRIERESMMANNVLKIPLGEARPIMVDQESIKTKAEAPATDEPAVEEEGAAAPTEAVSASPETPIEPAPAADNAAPLSNEDVNKLLSGQA